MEGFTITMQVTSPSGETRWFVSYDPGFCITTYRASLLADGWQCGEPEVWWGVRGVNCEIIAKRIREGG